MVINKDKIVQYLQIKHNYVLFESLVDIKINNEFVLCLKAQ